MQILLFFPTAQIVQGSWERKESHVHGERWCQYTSLVFTGKVEVQFEEEDERDCALEEEET